MSANCEHSSRSRRYGVLTFISVILLAALVVAACTLLIVYTLGYIGNFNMNTNIGVLHIQSIAQYDNALHIYAKNISEGEVRISSSQSGSSRIYINNKNWTNYQAKPENIARGEIGEIVISGMDAAYIGKTTSIKIVTDGGDLLETSVKVIIDGTSDGIQSQPTNFAIIVLPDTQYYSESYPAIFDNQTRWIVEEAENMNISFVSQEGDIVNNFSLLDEWVNANHSMSQLDGTVPWAVLPGNHDGLAVGTTYQNLFNYEKYFGDVNSYTLFHGGRDDYLAINLQYNPNTSVLAWANSTIAAYSDRRVIVTTHDYLGVTGSRSSIGERIWRSFIAPHADQIFLVLCGHNHGEAYRSDVVKGHTVYQVLADYQNIANGGNGWLRILEFHPAEDKIYVETYSPCLKEYETEGSSQFTFTYDMTSLPP